MAPLAIAVPLLMAALLAATSSVVGRRVVDIASTATALAVMVMCGLLVGLTVHARLVYAFGGWQPRNGIVLGVLFVVDPLGAGMATLVATLMTAALIYTWHYFREVRGLFHVMMLVFLAGMVGLCLSGDIFNMFVFFELMGVSGFALTGYKIEESGPLQGALNFGITNSIGAYLILTGIGLVYGRTGALNLAQIGHTLAGKPADGLVIMAFVLISAGFFIKAAVVPFHFWLPDAHAVAPTPVCVLFSGVMVELGLYAVFRIYWTVFAGTLGANVAALRSILLVMGGITALVGAMMCVLQHHLKRLLAFSTISHVGMFLMGAALLTPLGLGGSAVYVVAHGAIKASLFMCAGILLHRFKRIDEIGLRGLGRATPYTGVLFVAGGLGLAAMPPFGTFLGKGMIEDAAHSAGYPWVTVVLVLASILTAGAVLRAAGIVFLGWGLPGDDPSAANQGKEREEESDASRARVPALMFVPAVVLMAVGLVIGAVPNLGQIGEAVAAQFQDQPAYLHAVLGVVLYAAPRAALEPAGPSVAAVESGVISTAGAIAYALLALFWGRLPAGWRSVSERLTAPSIARLRSIQSGHIGDYVAWVVVGLTLFGAACAITLR